MSCMHVIDACPACGGSGTLLYSDIRDRAYFAEGSWSIFRCGKCGAGWLNPRPQGADLEAAYVDNYYTHSAADAPTLGSGSLVRFLRRSILSGLWGYKHLAPSGRLSAWMGSFLGQLTPLWSRASYGMSKLLLPYHPYGRLLDIGCGNGEYLALMKLLGWDVYGIEVDPAAAAAARERLDCTIYVGSIEDCPYEDGFFQAITSSHVLEHVPDPAAFVTHAARLLESGGRMVTVTPNLSSMGHKVFGRDWFPLDPPRHLCLFSPRACTRLFQVTGLFRRVSVSTCARASGLEVDRAHAVRTAGGFLRGHRTGVGHKLQAALLRVIVGLGNGLFRWGGEIECVAIKR